MWQYLLTDTLGCHGKLVSKDISTLWEQGKGFETEDEPSLSARIRYAGIINGLLAALEGKMD